MEKDRGSRSPAVVGVALYPVPCVSIYMCTRKKTTTDIPGRNCRGVRCRAEGGGKSGYLCDAERVKEGRRTGERERENVAACAGRIDPARESSAYVDPPKSRTEGVELWG